MVVGRRFEVFVKRVETLRGRVKWGDGLENGKVRVSQSQSRYTTNYGGFKEVAIAFLLGTRRVSSQLQSLPT